LGYGRAYCEGLRSEVTAMAAACNNRHATTASMMILGQQPGAAAWPDPAIGVGCVVPFAMPHCDRIRTTLSANNWRSNSPPLPASAANCGGLAENQEKLTTLELVPGGSQITHNII